MGKAGACQHIFNLSRPGDCYRSKSGCIRDFSNAKLTICVVACRPDISFLILNKGLKPSCINSRNSTYPGRKGHLLKTDFITSSSASAKLSSIIRTGGPDIALVIQQHCMLRTGSDCFKTNARLTTF